MRGKKIDNDFVTQFVIECANNNLSSSDEIVSEAQSKIEFIDLKIKEVESLKFLRSKLLDVVISFNDKKKKILNDKEHLSLYNIHHIQISKYICDKLKSKDNINLNFLKNDKFKDTDIAWCIKQLISHKIIYKVHNLILKGQQFDHYMHVVMNEKI